MKKNLGVFFGGVSPEHEVSVITGLQLIKHVNTEKYAVTPIYIDKAGKWWTGDQLMNIDYFKTQDLFAPKELSPFTLTLEPRSNSIDVAVLCFHGGNGENGVVQSALELAHIPYQGPRPTSSALNFDKIFTRLVLEGAHFPQTKFIWFTRADWDRDNSTVLSRIQSLSYPVFVKPANGGSTIGIERVKDEQECAKAIERVLQYDTRILVEAEVTDCIEINVAVLGHDGETNASVPEQPIKSDEFLSFADKYERGGKKSGMASATRRIPAPISSDLTKKLQQLAQDTFRLMDCSGVVRIDFFVNPSTEEIFITELNTIPGSMSFYLWEASGMSYEQEIDALVDIAETLYNQRQELVTSFETNILQKGNI